MEHLDRGASGPDATGYFTSSRIIVWSTALFVALRAVLVLVADTPSITPDELGSWAIAQYLVGNDIVMSMRDMPRYSLMSGALIAPVQALGLDPVLSYKIAIAWLSMLGLAAAALARCTVAMLRPDRPVLAASSFALVLLFPATLGTSSLTWAEPAVLIWWAVMAWGIVATMVHHRRHALLITSAVAALGPVVHGRLIAAPVIWIGAILITAAIDRRRGADRGADAGRADRADRPDEADRSDGALAWTALAVAITVAVAAGALALDALAASAIWDGSELVPAHSLAPTSLGWWRGLAISVTSRTWYLLAATLGLGGVGVVALCRTAFARRTEPLRAAAITIGLLLAGNFAIATLVSVPGLADLTQVSEFGGQRWDHVIYGRYIDGAVLVLAMIGLLASTRLSRRALLRIYVPSLVVLVVAGIGLQLRIAGADLAPSIDLMIGGVSWIPNRGDGLAIVAWTAVAAAGTACCAGAVWRDRRWFMAVLAVWIVLGALLGSFAGLDQRAARSHADLVSQLGPPDRIGQTVVIPEDVEQLPLWRLGVFAQQRDLAAAGWNVRFVGSGPADPPIGASLDVHDVGAVILVEGVSPGSGWRRAADFSDATVWRAEPDA